MTREQSHGDGDSTRARGIALARVWPEIESLISPEDGDLAARVLTAPMLTSDGGTLSELIAAADPTAFGFLVTQGVVFKETVLSARSALELLGPGDVLAPPLTASRQLDSRAVSRYIAHGPASIAVIDHRFRQAARRWPELSDLLHDRLGQQTHRASMHLAMLHQTRVEDRILSLFADLAERFGRMTPEGVIIDLGLTHELIGRLVGAQRPTVSLALSVHASEGVIARLETGAWRVAPEAMAT